MIKFEEHDISFAKNYRIFIAGMSSSGKTHFTYSLLRSGLFEFSRVYYYHPDFLEKCPVDWKLDKPIIFQSGLPSLKEILAMPKFSTMIFDDLFAEIRDSKVMDYLYRVLSSKQQINAIVLTQRYYDKGKFSLSIRNSSNYHVLLRNSDERTNFNVGKMMGLTSDVKKAILENSDKLYPYIFLDKTNEARVHKLNVFIDIFSKYKVLIRNSMKYYLISEADFNASFEKTGDLASFNGHKTTKICQTKQPDSETGTDTGSANFTTTRTLKRSLGQFTRSRTFERSVDRALQKYKKRSEL